MIGAGPAGSSLALRLARQGRSVLLVDGATFPREKTCGEGLMPAGADELRSLGLAHLLDQGAPFRGLRYRLPDGTRAESDFPAGQVGTGLRRALLDEALVSACQAEPELEVRLRTWVRELELPGDGGSLPRARVGEEWVEAELVVGADGLRSPVRRLAGLEAPAPKLERFGVGGHFRHAPLGDPVVEVFVGPGWELYTTPVAEDVTNAALLTDRARLEGLRGDLEGGLRGLLREAGGRCEALAAGESLHRVRALGPLALQATRAHAERLILVGDAAGALDPITGEGVSIGLVTSRIASEVIAEAFAAGDLSARALASWTRRRRAEIAPLARFTSALLFLARRPRHAARVIRSLAEAPGTFGRLLGVAAGTAPISSISVRDGVRLLIGV